jgi:hypothetical protein
VRWCSTYCPDPDSSAKDPGVLNIAGALPSSIAPAIAPAILAVGGGSYAALYGVAGVCAIIAAVAICRSSASDGQVHRRPAGRGLRRCQGEAQAGGQECRVPWRTMTWEVSWLGRCSTPSSTGRPAGAAW